EYLTKPFTAQLLLTRLERTFARKQMFKQVDAAIDIENYPLAIKYCDQLLVSSPKKMQTSVLKKRAELAIHTQDYSTAQHIYQDILEQRELNWALLGAAQINYLQGNIKEAIGIFQEIISKYPMTMEAYDLLAQSYEATEQYIEAQEALHKAVQLSPQTILRQRKLATIATNKTGDLETAETACQAAILLGKYSVHKSSYDFANLAQIFKKADKKIEALEILQTMCKEFPNDPSAELRAAIAQSEIYQSMGEVEQAEATFNEALSISKQYDQILDKEIKLEMSKVCYQNNQEVIADELINKLIKSHIDDDNFINNINAMYSAIGRESHAEELINTTRQELIHINNEGVKLYKQKKFIEAIAVFAKAFKTMPDNKTIILNMTKIILHNIKASGCTKENMTEAKFYIDKAKKLGVTQRKLNSIQMEYAKLVHSMNKPPIK
ncbi:MAG: tetratricopeptide repeat protein, partial [Methyloprofundus sp.]|nr:tetratricopeptide repeat protein [Methyloprofundus sp.]